MRRDLLSLAILLSLGLTLAGCPREKRSFHSPPARNARPLPVRLVTLQPGAALPKQSWSGPYEGNAWAISQGDYPAPPGERPAGPPSRPSGGSGATGWWPARSP